MLKLKYHKVSTKKLYIDLPASKSISNRLLILKALFNDEIEILNLSTAEDTLVLQKALKSPEKTIHVGMAGTAFRFLTSYYAIQEGEVVLTGDERMKQRPIAALVDALQSLGADIEYLEKKGYPPLYIKGKSLEGGKLSIDASLSSQYVSSLLLIAAKLKLGLQLEIQDKQVSRPYTEMTVSILENIGLTVHSTKYFIDVNPGKIKKSSISVEADWSAAAFFYNAMIVCEKDIQLFLKGILVPSIQGDAFLIQLYSMLGIKTELCDGGVLLSKKQEGVSLNKQLDFSVTPDLVQAFLVSCAVLKQNVEIKGVKNLKIKETDRILAMQTELAKIGSTLEMLDDDRIRLKTGEKLPKSLHIKTYNDHRMAMAFAPLAFLVPDFYIENIDVVRKSFPTFWEELSKMGIEVSS